MRLKTRRGQFQIMAAFMVLVIMTSAMIAAFNRIQDNPFKEPVTLATMIKSVNNSLHELLGFTAGYYGSIIKLTGNVTYAKDKTNSYFVSGLETVAHSDINNAISLTLQQVDVSTNWFGKVGFTRGSLIVNYDIPTLGLYGVSYLGSASLNVTILETIGGVCKVKVLGDNNEPNLSLTKDNFSFFKFDTSKNVWTYLNPTLDPTISNSGIYSINLPSVISSDAYYLQVVDQRGIMVSSGYVRGAGVSNKDQASYTYTFTWDHSLNENMEIELLQNGTLRWLGQALPPPPNETKKTIFPIPPIPVKGIHLNETVSGKNKEVPFQVEDWGSDYQVPLGMTSSSTIFNENCMIVFLINCTVTKATLWWDGADTAVQTQLSYNTKFPNDNSTKEKLDNGVITLDLSHWNGDNGYVRSITKSGPVVNSFLNFLRVNNATDTDHHGLPTYGSDLSYTIQHGVVRDIVEQEPEWQNGIPQSPDFYGHVVLTLPYGTNYYTYRVRTIFVPTNQTRNLSDLSVIQLSTNITITTPITENGLLNNGKPKNNTGTTFYDGYPSASQHQWSEFIGSPNQGVGLFFTSKFNNMLYYFDKFIDPMKTGEIWINQGVIELDPIRRQTVPSSWLPEQFDTTWVGAVANFNSASVPIYPYHASGGGVGLWILAEHPPTVSIK